MIISIRGTMGAGKSTLVRRIMARLGDAVPVFGAIGRVPVYLEFDGGISVLGHYQNQKCCGVDTIVNLTEAYALAAHLHGSRGDVIMEGRCDADGTRRIYELVERGIDCRVLFIDSDLDTCVAGVRSRGGLISAKRIEATHRRIATHAEQMLKNDKLTVFSGSRDGCYREAMRWLKLRP